MLWQVGEGRLPGWQGTLKGQMYFCVRNLFSSRHTHTPSKLRRVCPSWCYSRKKLLAEYPYSTREPPGTRVVETQKSYLEDLEPQPLLARHNPPNPLQVSMGVGAQSLWQGHSSQPQSPCRVEAARLPKIERTGGNLGQRQKNLRNLEVAGESEMAERWGERS